MKLGEKQVLTVVKIVDFGVYLGNDEERVLLPKKQVPEGIEPGDPVEVFLYRDSSDRLIATTNEPKLTMGHLAVLEVADTGKMGAFLDWGLEKDLFLPFKEQTAKVQKGDKCLVRGKIPQQMDADAELILKRIQSYDGVLPFNDKADPDTIKAEFGMSKAAFKRAVGRLLKENRVKIFPDSIRIR